MRPLFSMETLGKITKHCYNKNKKEQIDRGKFWCDQESLKTHRTVPCDIHYGYVGRVLFSEDVLLKAGGAVQIVTGTSKMEYIKTNFDDPHDQAAIGYGSYLWDLGG